MESLDIVRISGLTSVQRHSSTLVSVGSASVNAAGRVAMTPISYGETCHILFNVTNAVRLKLHNVTVLPNSIGPPWMALHRMSLHSLVESRKVDFSFLPTCNSIRNEGKFEPSSKASELDSNWDMFSIKM